VVAVKYEKGSSRFVMIDWDRNEFPVLVNEANLARVGPNSRFARV